MRRGVGPLDAAGEDGDRGAVDGQSATVRAAVDAERRARHDRPPSLGDAGREVGGHLLAVAGGGPRADDRDGALHGLGEVERPTDPEAVRRHRDLAEAVGPLVVAGHDDASAHLRGDVEVALGVDRRQSRSEPGERAVTGAEAPQGLDRAQLVDETGHLLVARLRDPGQRRASEPVSVHLAPPAC